ncbi:MAG: hypothetical protein IJQ56_05435 [Synergistaceae bacterium]|nr:hypothetical protein [Synergistaceae bacterium]MBR0203793.1 hypothetical protein [Synergistaceae bacterium]
MNLFIKEFEAILEKAASQNKPYWAVIPKEYNRTLIYAYGQSKERGNQLIDFNEVVWDYDVEPIVSTLRSLGVKEFTFSSTMASGIDILAGFKKLDAVIQDVVYVNNYKKEKIPAILMKIN